MIHITIFILLVVGAFCFSVSFLLLLYLSFNMKKYDPDGYRDIFWLHFPVSPYHVVFYVLQKGNVDKYPPSVQWVIPTIKNLMIAMGASFIFLILGTFVFQDELV